MTDRTLRVPEYENIWAVGDCAHIPDAVSGQRACPPSVQHAIRQGQTAAENVIATLDGTSKGARPYTFNSLGTLVGLGRYTAVAEVMGVRFSGPFAWFLWRSTYLFKLPGFQKKARVMLDWTLDLFFPRDITLTESEIPNEVRYRVAGVSTESPENFERETAS